MKKAKLISSLFFVLLNFTSYAQQKKLTDTERYFQNVEIQCEEPQWPNIKRALTDILTLSEKELKNRRYDDYTGKPSQWDLETLIYGHFVPDTTVFFGKNFYHEIKSKKIEKIINEILSKTSQEELLQSITSDENAMMQNADSVILYRLDDEMSSLRMSPRVIPPNIIESNPSPFDFYNTDRNTDYLKISKRKMTKVEIEKLMTFISASSRPTSNPIDNCRFAPGAGIKFYKGKERFYLLLCFNCNIWAFSRREAMYYIQFDQEKRKELVEYAKKLFPTDRDFQSLK